MGAKQTKRAPRAMQNCVTNPSTGPKLYFANNLGIGCSSTGTVFAPSTPQVSLTFLDVAPSSGTQPNWSPDITPICSLAIAGTMAPEPSFALAPTATIQVSVPSSSWDPSGASIDFFVPPGAYTVLGATFTMTYPFNPTSKTPAPLAVLTGTVVADGLQLTLTGYQQWSPLPQTSPACKTTSADYQNFIPVTFQNACSASTFYVTVTQSADPSQLPVFADGYAITNITKSNGTYAYQFGVPKDSPFNFAFPQGATVDMGLVIAGKSSAIITWSYADVQALYTPGTLPLPLVFNNTSGSAVAAGILNIEPSLPNMFFLSVTLRDAVPVNVVSNIRAYYTGTSALRNSQTTSSNSSSITCSANRPVPITTGPCDPGLNTDMYSAYECDIPTNFLYSGLKYPKFAVSVAQISDGMSTTVPSIPSDVPFVATFPTPDYTQGMYVVSVTVTIDGNIAAIASTAQFPLQSTASPLLLTDASGKVWAQACVDASLTINVNEYVLVGKYDNLPMDPFNVDAMMNSPIYASDPGVNFTPGVAFTINTVEELIDTTFGEFMQKYCSGSVFATFQKPDNVNHLFQVGQDCTFATCEVGTSDDEFPWANIKPVPQLRCHPKLPDNPGVTTLTLPTTRTLNGSRAGWANEDDPLNLNSYFTFDVKTDENNTPFLALRSLKFGYQGFAEALIGSVGSVGAYMVPDASACAGTTPYVRWAVALSQDATSIGDVCLLAAGPVACNDTTFQVYPPSTNTCAAYFAHNIYQVVSTQVFYEWAVGANYDADLLLSLYMNGPAQLPAPAEPAVTVYRLWLPFGPLIAFRNNWVAGTLSVSSGDASAAVCQSYEPASDFQPDVVNSSAKMFPFRSTFNLSVVTLAGVGLQSFSNGCDMAPSYASTCLTTVTNAPPGTCRNNLSSCVVADTALGYTYTCDMIGGQPWWIVDESALTSFVNDTCIAVLKESEGYTCAGIANEPQLVCTGFTSSNFGDTCNKACGDFDEKLGPWLHNSDCDAVKNGFCGAQSSLKPNSMSADCSCINFNFSSYATSAVVPPMLGPSTFKEFIAAYQGTNPILLEFQDTVWPPCTAGKHALRLNAQVQDWPPVAVNCFTDLYNSAINNSTLNWDSINDCVGKYAASSSGSSGSSHRHHHHTTGSNGGSNGDGSTGLPTYAIALIAVGAALVIAAVIAMIVVIPRQRRKRLAARSTI